MAVTKIKAIRGTLSKAIAYILNPEKTDEKLLVSSYGCASETAAREFEWTRKIAEQKGMNPVRIIARHVIQSFEIGEVTPELAHEIGKQFADEILGGKYEYVLTTHIDKDHVHNHLIFNAVDFVGYHAYKSYKRIYYDMREVSDRLCKENGLSVIPPSQNKGMGYKEYTEAKRGTSWKQKLKQTIDRLVITAKDYDDFLRLMQEAGYEIKTGKYISFRAEGQERFTRSKTIGENYTEERIKERIAGRTPRRSQRQATPKGISLIGDIQERIRLIDSKGYEHKAKLTILKEAARMAFSLSAEAVDFIVPSGNISPACLQSVPTAANPFLLSKIKMAHLLPERKSVMNNKIEVFKNEQFGEVRTILEGETLLFCGSDIAKALGYARPGKAIIDHCKGVLKRDTLTSGGMQSLSYIPEGDVYRLIVHSKLPAAEKFEHWLFDEVVPTIRKTGGYMTDSLLERIQKEPAVIVEFAQALILEKNRVKALECELNTAKPKADYYDAFINPDDCTNIRTTAKELKIPERKFVQFLLREKYLFRSPSGQLLPYNKDSNAGLFIVRDFVTYCYTGSQTYFTPKGKDVIRMKFQKKCGEELLPKMAR